MYRTHVQCAEVGRAARPKPASLPARGLKGGLDGSTTQTASTVAAVSAGRTRCVVIQSASPLAEGKRRSESCLTPFLLSPFLLSSEVCPRCWRDA